MFSTIFVIVVDICLFVSVIFFMIFVRFCFLDLLLVVFCSCVDSFVVFFVVFFVVEIVFVRAFFRRVFFVAFKFFVFLLNVLLFK